MTSDKDDRAYLVSKDRYAEFGVDTEKALKILDTVALSIHCWQGDDVRGFEQDPSGPANSGLHVSGGFPGKPRTIDELRRDLQAAYALIPGHHRLNLHAIYADTNGRSIERNAIEPSHFRSWVEWAKHENLKIDFNATCFAHPLAESGFTLSHPDKTVRKFWIEHVKCSRKIAASIGRELQSPCIHNLWIPDGCRDIPADRWKSRVLLKNALDDIFSVEHSLSQIKDALESKLFGIGSESFVVGSHEFYLGYALTAGKMICLDLGHFHPTESVADKISAILQYTHELLIHVSRGIRWDSDHVVIFDDAVRSLAEEIVGGPGLDRVHLALDYFDGTMNRIGAWVLGARAVLKAVLSALLLPRDRILEAEQAGDNFLRLALREESKSLPFAAVWDRHCRKHGVPPGDRWIPDIAAYEKRILADRA
ncbi:MAG: L-rhamnose isomerase [Acidobacteriota bacterium]|nr:L-rhamnose isomerase [Acidobacteriota bacterium]